MGLFSRKHDNGAGTKKIFKCEYCNMTFDEKERMKRHIRKAHGEKGGGDMPNMNPFGF